MKRTRINSTWLLVGALAIVLVGLAPSTPRSDITTDRDINVIVSSINSNNIFNTAQTLQNFRTRQSCSDQPQPGQGVTSARDFLFSQYSAIQGLQVRLDPFVHSNCPNSPTFNVIAWLPGNTPNRLVINRRSLRFTHNQRFRLYVRRARRQRQRRTIGRGFGIGARARRPQLRCHHRLHCFLW